MGFFKRSKEKVGGNENPASGSNAGWEGVKNVRFAGEVKTYQMPSPEERKKQDAERQQRKIAAGILYGAQYALSGHDVALNPGDMDRVLDGMESGEIGDPQEREFLSKIQDPFRAMGSEQMYQRYFSDKHSGRILAYMTGGDPSHYEGNTSQNVDRFLQRFPLPMDFEAASGRFLANIRQENSEAKYQEYVSAMEDFKLGMYGKRQEYWSQIKEMHNEAINRPSVERAPQYEQQEWLRASQVEGDPWVQDGYQYQLSPQLLEGYGLGPEFKARVEGVDMRFSGAFKVGDHDAMIGYIKGDDGKVHVRGYYRSNSQGVWRYLPDYVNNGAGHISYYGKGGFGAAEESTTLPFELQKKLSAITSSPEGAARDISHMVNPDFVLGGTAGHFYSKDQLREAYAYGTARGAFYREVARRPSVELSTLQEGAKEVPENLDLIGGIAPDFEAETSSFDMNTGMYGNVKARVFKSQDRQYDFMMCENGQGQAWLSSIQKRSKITTTGCRAEWVSAGDYATPLYDYASQAGGYGDEWAPRAGNYVSMWGNYLRRVPIIQRYLNRGQRQRQTQRIAG